MSNNKLTEMTKLIDKLGELSKQSRYYYEQYKKVEEEKAAVKISLMRTLQDNRLRSAKTSNFTASISSKPTIQIIHEQSILDWLQETPDVETDQYIGLKKTEFKSLATSMLKNTGELVPGTEVVEAQSLSIRKNK